MTQDSKALRLQRLIDDQALHVCRVSIQIMKIEKGLPRQPRTAKLRKQHDVAYTRLNSLLAYQRKL